MKEITGYIKRYARELNYPVFVACTLLTAFMIWANYFFGINARINRSSQAVIIFYRFIIFLVAFGLPWFFYFVIERKNYFRYPLVPFLIIISPLIFSFKVGMDRGFRVCNGNPCNEYWNEIIYWPLRLLLLTVVLLIIWKSYFRDESFFGLTKKNFKWKPYFLMLLIMVPLVAAASMQNDFLSVYPKMKTVSAFTGTVSHSWFYKFLFELSYGSDFISIELFFRGFLILAFLKIAGKDAILPMACFYCTIHFGKPLGECISSYFGAILLGIVIHNTRSIYGGLIVHLGIAWLMEFGGYLGNLIK